MQIWNERNIKKKITTNLGKKKGRRRCQDRILDSGGIVHNRFLSGYSQRTELIQINWSYRKTYWDCKLFVQNWNENEVYDSYSIYKVGASVDVILRLFFTIWVIRIWFMKITSLLRAYTNYLNLLSRAKQSRASD